MGPCPAHPILPYMGGLCQYPKNKTSEAQHTNNYNGKSHNEHSYYYSTTDWGCGHGHGSYNVPCCPNPFSTFCIQQAPINAPLYALSKVKTLTLLLLVLIKCMLPSPLTTTDMRKIADSYATILFPVKQLILMI